MLASDLLGKELAALSAMVDGGDKWVELSKLIGEDRVSGSVTFPPWAVVPDPSYHVPQLDGEIRSLERVSLNDM